MALNETRRTSYGSPTSSSAQRTRVSRASPLPPSGDRSKAVMVMAIVKLRVVAQGSVAKATHAGLPWLRYLRRQAAGRVHFWPLDGWAIPTGRSVVAEVRPSLWGESLTPEGGRAGPARRLCVAAREHRRSCSRTEHSSAHIPLRLERGRGSWRPPAPASVACRTRLGRVYPGGTAVRDTELRLVSPTVAAARA